MMSELLSRCLVVMCGLVCMCWLMMRLRLFEVSLCLMLDIVMCWLMSCRFGVLLVNVVMMCGNVMDLSML